MDRNKLNKKIEELESAAKYLLKVVDELRIMAEIPTPSEKALKARQKKAILEASIAAVVKKRNDFIMKKNLEARNNRLK